MSMLAIGTVCAALGISFTLAVLTTRLSIPIAYKLSALDQIDDIKVHSHPTPRLGGLGIILGFLLPATLLQELHPLAVAGAIIISITGGIDDRYSLKPAQKIIGELLAGIVLATYIWIVYQSIEGLFIGMLAILISIGLSNAMNLIDGLDGLAAGSSLISAVGLAALFALQGRSILLALLLVGALLGFLVWNYPRAKTFMGDVGSLSIGYILSLLLLDLASGNILSLLAGLIMVGVPIYDAILGIARRSLQGRPLFEGDRGHFYDQINGALNSTIRTVWIVYAINIVFVLIGLLAYINGYAGIVLAYATVATALVVISKQFGFLKG